MKQDEERHSKAFDAELITDPDEKAKKEARNGLRQYDFVVEAIEHWITSGRTFKLRPSLILQLNRIALEGISAYAGNYRPSEIKIEGSKHQPVGAHLVPEKIEELCDYVNDNWNKSAIHLAAYVMWRLNWIHPFADGNGRTSRALSYLVLCIRLGEKLPGTLTVPDQISSNKSPYYEALEAADRACSESQLQLTRLEELLKSLLAAQLVSILKAATESQKQRPQ
jgi:Fic family protein